MEWNLLGDNKTLEEVGDIIAEDFKNEFKKRKMERDEWKILGKASSIEELAEIAGDIMKNLLDKYGYWGKENLNETWIRGFL